MNSTKPDGWRSGWGLTLLGMWLILVSGQAAETVIYETRFEASEGYSTERDLSGQNGWIGSGADGILTNFFEGQGQQAYVGFSVPRGDTNDFFSVYQPVNFAPLAANQPLVRFSVQMQIVDSTSTNGPWDDFRWSVYNTNGTRLFSLDFDNEALLISYLLDDGAGFVSTETGFDTQGYYDLVLEMNFASNRWRAVLNDQVIVNERPITTAGSPLHLGDIDAVWLLRHPGNPGDNYMLFDNYRITAEATESMAPRLEAIKVEDGAYHARLFGEPGTVYQIEGSNNLRDWQVLFPLTAPAGGMLEFQDPGAAGVPFRFYRARRER